MKKKKRRRLSLDELNAYKRAYGRPLQAKDYGQTVFFPALIGGGLTFLLLHQWLIALFFAFLFGWFGYAVLLPKNVLRFYEHQALIQRNRWMNNLTQLFSDGEMSWFQGIQLANQRTEGAFREDLDQLLATLYDAPAKERSQAFQVFQKKYDKDVIFRMYLEQVEILALEGRHSIETLKDINHYHNQIKECQRQFVHQKKIIARQFLVYGTLILGILLLLQFFPLGFSVYYHAFASTWVGWITSGLFLLTTWYLLARGTFYYFDDAVMEVKL